MAPDEYSTGGGGKLKLKGSKVSDGRVDKKKKKSKKKEEVQGADTNSSANADTSVADMKRELNEESPGKERDLSVDLEGTPESGQSSGGKTETERKYEEVRRKRLRERLQRDGIKTHKERVEELNKYLSRLSEHHDMPKIGPG